MTTITLTGLLGADAELRYTASGTPALRLSIGHTPRRKIDGQWKDAGPTTWYQATVWGQMAEALAEVKGLTSGARVTVLGDLTVRPYDSASGPRLSHDVRVQAIGWEPKREHQTQASADDWGVPQAEVPGW